jgi:NitT/TauT family transport system substrate-binding protein
MKKLLLVLAMLFTTTLVACEKEEVDVKIIAPKGTPALAQTYFEHEQPEIGENATYSIEIVGGTDPLVAAFTSGSHDIIYAPTNLGAKLISTGLEYTYAGAVVWGTLYIGTQSEEPITIGDLNNKELIVFGQNATPDVVVQTVTAHLSGMTIKYVGSAADAQAEILLNPSAYVLLTEPLLSVTKMKIENLQTIDLQTEWEQVTGMESYPMAGIFVKNSLIEARKDVVDTYLELIAESVDYANSNNAEVAEMAVELEYGFPLPVLTGAIPNSNLRFVNAEDSREDLEYYFSKILDLNPALIGGTLPEDNFYF